MEQPVIFLAFANSQDAHLNMLKRESRNINKALEPLDDKSLVKIAREESAGLEEVFHNFNRFQDRIFIFHYGGHANGTNLEFEGDSGNAEGLATLFSQQKSLKLVFLNGCSTKGQVDRLLELGVPAVIATSVPISDSKATEFSEQFYRAMANKSTIKAAFQFAVSWLQAKYGDTETPTIVEDHRGFVNQGQSPKDVMPWGLYLNKSATDILDWTLPTQFVSKVARPQLEHDFQVNDYIYDILNDMIAYEPSFERRLIDAEGNELDDRQLLALIIGNYPWTIGSQLRRLVSRDEDMNTFSVRRLEQIVNTHVLASQLLFYILLSQLWEEKRKLKDKYPLSVNFLDALQMDESNYLHFDYYAQVRQILQEMKENNIPFFVSEFEDVLSAFNQKGEFFNAYIYLESLRSRLLTGSEASLSAELPQLCADGEYSLSVVLGKIAFLIRYQMLTVRDIIINNPRHEEATFNHYMGNLKAQDNDFLSLFKEPKSYEIFVDSRSVILVKDLSTVNEYLNLSPFIIDKNAFGDAKSTSTDLFMYAFVDEEGYHYFSIRHSVFKDEANEGDKLHTGYEEKSEVQNRKRSRVRGRAGRSAAGAAVAEEANNPYAMLKAQFEHFREDLSK